MYFTNRTFILSVNMHYIAFVFCSFYTVLNCAISVAKMSGNFVAILHSRPSQARQGNGYLKTYSTTPTLRLSRAILLTAWNTVSRLLDLRSFECRKIMTYGPLTVCAALTSMRRCSRPVQSSYICIQLRVIARVQQFIFVRTNS